MKESRVSVASAPSNIRRSSKYARVEEMLKRFLARLCQLFLSTFSQFSDSLLAISAIRQLVAWALVPVCKDTFLKGLLLPEKNTQSFNEMAYHVSPEVQQVLVHASLHSLIQRTAQNRQHVSGLPPLGRILLQTGSQSSLKYQLAVASALANKLQASLLVVDNKLLLQVAEEVIGAPLDRSDSPEAGSFSISAFLLSLWLSGGRTLFVWDMLRRVCDQVARPLVVFLPESEKLLCSSYERLDAFQHHFGPPGALQGQARNGRPALPLVLIGGCRLSEEAADLANSKKAKNKDDESSALNAAAEALGEDLSASLLSSTLDFGLSQDDVPNPRWELPKLFPTRVKLTEPRGGKAAARHQDQIRQDTRDQMAEQNHQHLVGLVSDRKRVPDKTSRVYLHADLSRADWAKVLAWACSMDHVLRTKGAKEAVESLPEKTQAAPSAAEQEQQQLKERRSSGEEAGPASPPTASDTVVGRFNSMLRLICSIVGVSSQAPAKAPAKGKGPKADRVLSPAEQAAALELAKCLGPSGLSEEALWYGIKMQAQSGGRVRQAIKAANTYEKRLLPDVVHPQEAGSGFADVGALDGAKDALREAVQLPLQFPHLFPSGSLAGSCKGVLLFGPPGTGKTLLARAAAAECGASFLAIQPSTVTSKWFGDSVRYVKAAFSLAAKLAPCVLFVDEVDAILSQRGRQSEHEALREVKNEFMQIWDGIRASSGAGDQRILVLGATNRPYDLDEAVLRRFPRRVFCDLPNVSARQQILEVMLENETLDENVDLAHVASRTEGFSGSDLKAVCTAAAMRPLRELLKASGKSAQAQKQGAGPQRQRLKQEPSSKPAVEAKGGEPQRRPQEAEALPAMENGHAEDAGAPPASLPDQAGQHDKDSSASSTNSRASSSTQLDASGHLSEEALSRPAGQAQPERSPPEDAASDRPGAEGSTALQSSSKPEAAAPGPEQSGASVVGKSRGREPMAAVLGMLMDECSHMSATAADMATPAKLRPISAADFEHALDQVAPSSNTDSTSMNELQQWNSKYGEAAQRGYKAKLSYFI